ncbi:hypothetical protein GEMRC1_005680 [Eukaryota sp. GEM-RC1]
MIDQFIIFHIGGAILWRFQHFSVKNNPVNTLIQSVLLEKKETNPLFSGNYSLYWKRTINPDLVLVAVCQSIVTLVYSDELLSTICNEFLTLFKAQIVEDLPSFLSNPVYFDERYSSIVSKFQTPPKLTKPKETAPFQTEDTFSVREKDRESSSDNPPSDDVPSPPSPPSTPSSLEPPSTPKKSKKNSKKGKKLRKKIGEVDHDTDALDFSVKSESSTPSSSANQLQTIDINANLTFVSANPERKSVWGVFSGLSGKEITVENLQKFLAKFRELLIEKNVALEVTNQVIDSVQSNLIGKTAPLGGFQAMVKSALRDVIAQILTPSAPVNVLSNVIQAKSQGQTPYSIVFCGVNGVGKSTNLAKVAFYLKQHDVKVLIAACDTFRSGAVEQLRVHSERLNIELFSRDYGTSPAAVARAALEYGKRHEFDCVLIDTAGRMQDNEPLMQSLAELCSKNNPNLVLFVGECLVGNDGVDQLQKFDEALKKRVTGQRNGQGVDGILLTKFDTVDTKVGSALSTTFVSGKPIVFIGVGQNYVDLRSFNTDNVVEALMC